MNLYVIRHGKTNSNKNNIYNGSRKDERINEEGRKQAKAAEKEIKKLDIDIIICSPMIRTKETAAIINSNLQKEIIYDDRLKDRDLGALTNKSRDSVKRDDLLNFYKNANIVNLEGLKDLHERVHDFLAELKLKYPNKNILIVTHAGVARAIHYYFNEIPADGKLNFPVNNCEIFKYEL